MSDKEVQIYIDDMIHPDIEITLMPHDKEVCTDEQADELLVRMHKQALNASGGFEGLPFDHSHVIEAMKTEVVRWYGEMHGVSS